jgi:hypothetical protein
MPGGRLRVSFSPDGAATLSGPVARVADGRLAARLTGYSRAVARARRIRART